MRVSIILLATMVLAACSGVGIQAPGSEQRAARNLCESMRSYRPYYPNQCGEQPGEVSGPYGSY